MLGASSQATKLPSNYIQWYEYCEYSALENSPHFHEYDCELQDVVDTFQPPYTTKLIGLNHFWGEVDSLFGELNYCADTSCTSLSVGDKGAVFIRWYPHEEVVVVNMLPFGEQFNYIAHEKKGMQKITIGGRKALRLRGWWWDTQCDDIYQAVGSFTTYLIPTEKLDFRITCLTQFYERDPHYWPEGVGYEDAVPEDWTYEKTGPDRIRELERAVEQTFRPKE
ncbi:hypothetical protein CEE36_05895 [candidate division TA06 bacterium B3_TA06]|uniref:Uncharacterized protein n=1 Tax=candidate division TA06 bacterium B3_TA06 TaxID=2012487 RepID=A0A532V739_UNCT6|nr:MAG: hypothetical protein CEE36_05895 [candidate division TA06 bacterium B3_TA06]